MLLEHAAPGPGPDGLAVLYWCPSLARMTGTGRVPVQPLRQRADQGKS
jgi:hypothetical protein